MTAVLKRDFISEDEYLAICERSDERLELIDGQIYAMTGGTGEHNTLTGNIRGLLWEFLRGKTCRPFSESMRVKVSSNDFFYPDVLVDCAYNSRDPLFAGKPIIIVEVLSPSTASYDRGAKFDKYKQIACLEEYVLVEQDIMNIKIYRRSDNWSPTTYLEGDDVEFQSIGLTVPIAEIYERIFS